ncbi:hypothetical protein B0H13DRAFT_1632648 [Mycena leptocephala]|nr:hypothetical protein B0H13DRAFT_1632648 [Mycena leptocephala]
MLSRHTVLPIGILQLCSSWFTPAYAQQTFFPSAVPLAVRSPTLNCWLDTSSGTNPMATWPTFWNHQHTLGWAGYIKVDGLTWHWLGNPGPGNASTWLATEVTPTRTILTVQAGPMRLNVTFLSPVEPSDWTKQSFPFSYVYVDGKATDGKQHSIQLYSDISGEWVTNNLGTAIQWNSLTSGNTVYHQVASTAPSSVFDDVAEDSVAYHAIASAQPGLVSVVGSDQQLRAQFSAAGEGFSLTSDLPGQFGNVRGGNGKFPVLAHALNLGVTDTVPTIAWGVGVVRDPITTFANNPRRAYYWSQYPNIGNAIDAFMSDFPAARARALALDQQILQDAVAVSQNYADLVSLGTRQAMAGVEITVPLMQGGSLNLSDVKAFMKDVGNSKRVNPIETIYAALPAFMYLNASITGTLLEPLLEYQSSSAYTNPYAAPDLGLAYPAVPGDSNNDAIYGVENSGDMLILVLAHAQSSGDGSLIGRYYSLLKGWADYLSTNALLPGEQTSADARDAGLGQSHGNVTNLALKGIIALQAMSEISQIMGQTADAQKYHTFATSLVQSWVDLTSASGQLQWTYDDDSFGLMYNLLADKLLKLNVVPASVSGNYLLVLSAAPPFGFPLSSDSNTNTRSDWTLFSAASAPDPSTRDLLISMVHKRATSNASLGIFPTLYNVGTGQGPGAGQSYSLSVANQTVVVPTPAAGAPSTGASGTSNPKKNTGAIIGGIVAAISVVLVLGGVAIFMRRRRKSREWTDEQRAPQPYQNPPNMGEMFGGSSAAPTSRTSDSVAVPPSRSTNANAFAFVSQKTALMASGQPGAPEPPASIPGSSHVPSSSGGRSSASQELRSEMQRLRQEVEHLRATQGVPQEAPPGYQ